MLCRIIRVGAFFTRSNHQMSLKKSLILLFSLVIAVYSLNALARKQEYPEVTEDGLHLVHHSRMAIVYAEPESD
jgi:hypothetical protein